MPRRSVTRLYKDGFTGYSFAKFQEDLLARLTVAVVALALAFGVSLGASAAAGLVEVIGKENFFWPSDQAIVEAKRRGCTGSAKILLHDCMRMSGFPFLNHGVTETLREKQV